MDWSNEPYVKVYTRETDDDLALSWEAVALWNQLMKRFDRSGFVETRRGIRGLAAITRIPLPVVERVLPELLDDGRLVTVDGGYLAPNYIAAQEASKSDKLRQKDSRDRRRARALDHGSRDADITPRDGAVTIRDASITDGHAESRDVTLCSADPDPLQSKADPVALPARAPAIPPSTEYDPQSPGDLIRLARDFYVRVATARDAVAAELGLRGQVPMPKTWGGNEPVGFRDLRERLRAEGSVAPQACDAVLSNLERDAREQRSVDWLSDKAFTERGWSTARNGGIGKRERTGPRTAQRSSGAIGSATPRTDHGTSMRPAKEVM